MSRPWDVCTSPILPGRCWRRKAGILNAETLRNCYTEQRRELAAKLKAYGAEIEFVSGAFADAERRTDVDAALIRVHIPTVKVDSTIVDDMRKAPTYKTQKVPSELTELVQYGSQSPPLGILD